MELDVMYKIKQDKKQYEYLRRNSYWYKYLNRDSKYYKDFLNAYKKNNRSEATNKVNNTINNIGMVTNILKVIE